MQDDVTDRIADSLQVFGQVCAEPMLANAAVILFLNKCGRGRPRVSSCAQSDLFRCGPNRPVPAEAEDGAVRRPL